MADNIQPLRSKEHAKTKIKNGLNVEFTKLQHLVPVVAHEFSRVANEYPLVFIKNGESGEFQPVVVFGLEPGENLFMKDDKWQGAYIPHALTRYPFVLSTNPNDETKLLVGINESSDLVNEDEGHALFDEKGEETDYLKRRKESLINFIEFSQVTAGFSKYLAEKELLIAQTLTLEIKGEKRDINGIHLIDEKKLNELSDEDFLDIRKRGFLGPIYSFLTSLHQINRLAKLKSEQM
ncbi:SapC family protein [Pseudoalteromonas denitrificans]|uniref:SapC protein n=1 Tax=Pseudoalteromonas denitrificans DSM 6059 TaxID=1123010 RepID=A0A1I1KW93_9GAMM|nr:SapC family protein [Pseudoalteromonas denitrificans]SFC64885.1 SapC protein [Pseudoalteromonas denitrificans DSM 6059]